MRKIANGATTCQVLQFVGEMPLVDLHYRATVKVRSMQPQPPALIVVGLPRSGSSFLAHVLSTLKDLWVFDDLYVLQKAEAITLGPMDDDQLVRFVDRLAWETRARVKWERDFDTPAVTLDDIDQMELDLLERHRGTQPLWHDVADEWVTGLAAANECSQWGYKTPQDFLHLERLHEVWPDARFVHLLRDPRDIMRSYKNLEVSKGGDGDPRSYHPIAYSLYWRMSQRRLQAAKQRGTLEVETVRFEQLVSHPDVVAERLASFLSTSTTRTAEVESHNSSLRQGSQRVLTDTEQWICQRLAGPELAAAGYGLRPVHPHLRDSIELLRVTKDFVVFQVGRAVSDPEKRRSVLNVATNILRGKNKET